MICQVFLHKHGVTAPPFISLSNVNPPKPNDATQNENEGHAVYTTAKQLTYE